MQNSKGVHNAARVAAIAVALFLPADSVYRFLELRTNWDGALTLPVAILALAPYPLSKKHGYRGAVLISLAIGLGVMAYSAAGDYLYLIDRPLQRLSGGLNQTIAAGLLGIVCWRALHGLDWWLEKSGRTDAESWLRKQVAKQEAGERRPQSQPMTKAGKRSTRGLVALCVAFAVVSAIPLSRHFDEFNPVRKAAGLPELLDLSGLRPLEHPPSTPSGSLDLSRWVRVSRAEQTAYETRQTEALHWRLGLGIALITAAWLAVVAVVQLTVRKNLTMQRWYLMMAGAMGGSTAFWLSPLGAELATTIVAGRF